MNWFRALGRGWLPLVLAGVLRAAGPGAWSEPARLEPLVLRVLAEARIAALARGSWPAPEEQAGVYVALREGGLLRAERWELAGPWDAALPAAIRQAAATLTPAQRETVDAIEICLNHGFAAVRLPRDAGALTEVHRGVRGLEIVRGRDIARFSPTQMLADNRGFDRVLELFAQARGLRVADLKAGDAALRRFESLQVLVQRGETPRVIPLFRGNELVPSTVVTRDSVLHSAGAMAGWLVRATQPDGRMIYKYWPSSGEESAANNVLRQMMATVALGRWAEFRGDDELRAVQLRNLVYNIATFYREEDGLGLIEENAEVKLGSTALAALALVESPWRTKFQPQEAALRRTVERLWQPGGEFRTYYKPAGKTGNVNFYPGEALLLWGTLIARGEQPELPGKFMQSFTHYRAWHLDPANRNPAFVPWHTQADVAVWRVTREPALRDFVFQMNDWLLEMQQWAEVVYPDLRGRFYQPARDDFGPPHASSTGVYLEGLADAFWLAREVNDGPRVARYRQAILRGVRNILQLQFADEVDMFYISRRDRVAGAVRTTEYDNAIRVDNVQHNLLAFLKVLAVFTDADFAVPVE